MPAIVSQDTARYVASADFETTIDTAGDEYTAQGNSNGLPRESLLKRSFIVVAETDLQVSGIKVKLPAGKLLTDVGQAHKVLKQRPANIAVRDRIRLEAGQELPASLGAALLGGGYAVKKLEHAESEAPADSVEAPAETDSLDAKDPKKPGKKDK